MKQFVTLGTLLLMACSSEPGATPDRQDPVAAGGVAPVTNAAAAAPAPQPTPDAPVLAVDGEGLRLFDPGSGRASPLPFGTDRALIMSALAGRGSADRGTQSECGAGPLDYAAWPDGLKLYFQQGKFAGWAIDDRAAGKITTAAGVGPGSKRTELDDAYDANVAPSTLGTEFTAGALFGLLDGTGPSASITAMWAGVSCNFR